MSFAPAVAGDCIDFHGIPIELAYQPFPGDAFSSLFAGFARDSARNHPLRIELARALEPCTDPVSSEWLPTFCHGLIQGYTRAGAHLLSDGKSRLEVFPRNGRVAGRLCDRDGVEFSSAMQHIALSLALRERGVFDLHAATACTDRQALLLVGDSGAGKTTLLLALLGLGCQFLGDDRLLFRRDDDCVELLAYPREFHLTARTAEVFPSLAAGIEGGPRLDGKYPFSALDFWPERFRKSWRGPMSLLLPHVEARTTTVVRPASAAEAFGKLLTSSAAVAVDGIERRQEQLVALGALANTAHAFEIALGTDLMTEPSAIARRILDAVRVAEYQP